MATYIKDLVEDNGDITRPVTEAGAVLLSGGGDLETTLASKADQTAVDGKISVGDVQSTDIVANAVTTAKIADDAVTTAKIDDGAVTGAKIDFSTITSAMLENIPIGTATATDYINFSVGTVNTLNAFRFGNIVMVNWDISNVGAVNGQKVVGTATNKIVNTAYGAGRVSGGSATVPATLVAIPGGQLRLHTTLSGPNTAGTIWLFVND